MWKQYRTRLLIGLMFAAAVIAAVVPEFVHHPGTLLTKSRQIAAVGNWDPKHDNYFWLSDNTVLLIIQAAEPAYEENAPVMAQRLNTVSGTIIAALPLNAALLKANADSLVPNWQLSPDKKWLLSETNSRSIKQSWVATQVNTAHQITRPHVYDEYEDKGLFTVWRPDSKSWVQIAEQSDRVHAYSYRLDNPAVASHSESTNLNGNVAVGFYSPDRIFCIRPVIGDGGGIGVMDLGVDVASSPVKNYIQTLPANMTIQEAALSPGRTLLAWHLAVKPLPLGLKATIDSSYVRRSAPNEAGLWVSDLNFNHLREIGTLDIRDDHISNLRWTPDETHLSFIDDGTLYAVPVN